MRQRRAALLVVTDRDLLTALEPATGGAVRVEPSSHRPEVGGLTEPVGRDARVIDLTLDGPTPALRVGSRYLADTLGVGTVVLHGPAGSPPPIEALVTIADAGLLPGVDSERTAWHSDTWLWWASDDGPSRIEHDLRTPAARRQAATLLAMSRDLHAGEPVVGQLTALAGDAGGGSGPAWADTLAWHYVTVALRRLLGRWRSAN